MNFNKENIINTYLKVHHYNSKPCPGVRVSFPGVFILPKDAMSLSHGGDHPPPWRKPVVPLGKIMVRGAIAHIDAHAYSVRL